jgi:hypothetical protein
VRPNISKQQLLLQFAYASASADAIASSDVGASDGRLPKTETANHRTTLTEASFSPSIQSGPQRLRGIALGAREGECRVSVRHQLNDVVCVKFSDII